MGVFVEVLMSLVGQVAIVTGGGQGIGEAIAARIAGEGASVVVADLNLESATRVVRAIEQNGGRGLACATDVSDPESVAGMVREAVAKFGDLDILVNNAGIGQNIMPAVDLSLEEWNRIMAVNLTGTLLCSREAAKHFMEKESGRILNISSLNGLSPAPLCIAYNVSKAGVISLTKTMAYELAPYHITVNAVCPGPVYTDFNRKVMSQRAAIAGVDEAEMVAKVAASIPLGRWVEAEDVAKAVVFLVSDESSYITGEVLTVSGGLSGVSGAVPKRR
jgi:NAD(P)-dependent dehydrogenase (short-subunit alcohol dehydrogenase family)